MPDDAKPPRPQRRRIASPRTSEVARDPVKGEAGRGYGGLSRKDYAERGPGRVFDRGEDYGRGDTATPGSAGEDSDDAGKQPRRPPEK